MAPLRLQWRAFAFALPVPLATARGMVAQRRGWLVRLEAAAGAVGWGEVAPLEPGGGGEHGRCAIALGALGERVRREELEAALAGLPAALAFGLGLALAELDGLGARGWRPAPPSAWLLPAGEPALAALETALAATGPGLTVKWKVAVAADAVERRLLERLLERLPAGGRLRLDANGGWNRPTAAAWADRLAEEPRLEWLEQPLAATDLEGLTALAAQLPVALDESLVANPVLRRRWPGWQVRRPALEGDPRPLLAALAAGQPRWMVSSAFETGVGRRLVEQAAALQAQGPTPTAPGLAPGWRPGGPLFAADPALAWAVLAEGER
ncbi:MAG: o-succinylbenzoate synthase [Cyanobacteriota bacterium]|nr:o-succinylbenzoate synthase [Cyanobacteriota bacterium]